MYDFIKHLPIIAVTGTKGKTTTTTLIGEILKEDGRKVIVNFTKEQNKTKVITVFEAENENPVEMQKEGWQSILDNFKKYVEDN